MVLPRSKLAKNLSARHFSSSKAAAAAAAKGPHGRNGRIHGSPGASSPEEDVRILARRMAKAERDERIDITLALTPVRSYMSGFTQPREFASSNWFPGGPYVNNVSYETPPSAAYEPHTVFLLESRHPVKYGVGRVDSYEHVVGVCKEADFPALMEKFNSARCPAASLEAMDNASWPWLPKKKFSPTVWWDKGERPEDVIAKLFEDGDVDVVELPESGHTAQPTAGRYSSTARATGGHQFISTDLLDATSKSNASTLQRRAFHFSIRRSADESDEPSTSAKDRTAITGSSWSRPPKPSQDANDHVVPTYYIERKRQRDSISERKEEEGGLMSELSAGILSEDVAAHTRTRDEKIPVEVKGPDGVIRHPSGFEPPTPETEFHPVAAKTATEDEPGSIVSTVKQLWDERIATDVAAGRISADPALQEAFIKRKISESIDTASVLSDKATTEQSPTPTAVPSARGGTASSTHQQRATIPTSSWDTPARSTAPSHDPDTVVPAFYIERKKQRNSISERKEEEGELMTELSAGILSEDLAAHTRAREEKIPVEVEGDDGVIRHPSGFEPPTPETEFHPTASKPAEGPPKIHWTDVPELKNNRGFHSSAFVQATEVPQAQFQMLSALLATPPPSPVQSASAVAQKQDAFEEEHENALNDAEADEATLALRAQYLPTLGVQPFWRPLLTMTFSTRPLALSVARLARARERGLPFYASVAAEDRKCRASFPTRMRNMRMDRMQDLAIRLGRLLHGERGGLIGVRFAAGMRGRGVGGEGLAEPLSRENRLIKVGVGAWYSRAEEVQATFKESAAEAELEDGIEVFGVDEHGLRADGVPWPPRVPAQEFSRSVEELAVRKDPSFKPEEMPLYERKARMAEIMREHKVELATALVQTHSAVSRP
ncbi:hypothetical protein B0H21DRAFT_522514 [Amylocystis lapponica]|nr:hypothetical protein B0H21DRAFT_522514 [Amylocystis lapponica]